MGGADEAEVKRKLGIETWRNVSKDKVLRFAAAMPDMATEARLKLIEQFPSFKDLGKSNIDAVKEAHKETLASNDRSQDHFHRASQDQRDAIREDLGRDGLSWEQREALHDRLDENVGREYQKDSENKQFLVTGLKVAAAAGAAVLVMGVAFVGGKAAIEGRSDGAPEN
ncbi:hypothetical protein [Kitasatospora sp. NPDC101183]|uniref:hypothetical protein n=1 Tax=Kitasatospora sp. NPDC101183 TaxID=3364100 RepID=UPI003800B769